MLLDEPVTILDLGPQLEVLELIAELNQLHETTVVIVLHDLNLAALLSVLDCLELRERLRGGSGRVKCFGKTSYVSSSGQVLAAGLIF